MKYFFQQNRLVIAVVAMALWFGGLNLCAFAVLAGTGIKSSGCPFCHGDGSSSKLCDKYTGQEAAPSSQHGSISLSAASLPVIDFVSFDGIRVIQPNPAGNLGATIPYGERCFAELVLQESLFAQAPPVG
ncbi:MAG TPA: hypothetical protein VK717_09385 [Opitutaceae bacterium]|jgi:hypothetical protein|nr:hypothetical protein [Opitutaceae bacterium]